MIAFVREGLKIMDIGIITGSGFYEISHLENMEKTVIDTDYGTAKVTSGTIDGCKVHHIARHGIMHKQLSNHVNYRANIAALDTLGVDAIISTTACGVLLPSIPLGKLFVFDDMFFPDNRLPDGSFCTMFESSTDPNKGHYISKKPFSRALVEQFSDLCDDCVTNLVYGQVAGPRFNTQAEIKWLSGFASAISQTGGFEAVLAGEMQIPFCLLGYGMSYANGVSDNDTSIDDFAAYIEDSNAVFSDILVEFIRYHEDVEFEGEIYQF